ncbi:MAG: hypothetical protein A2X78_04570 [Gammaproteobacteria bacterium GWE2_37_16]|nr:MAG: hypothetical protein A2X78_04570 [Gammaproteobacteria bacterium GWE2_37_16]
MLKLNKILFTYLLFGSFFFSQQILAKEYCTKNNTTAKMSFTEAQQIASASKECVKVGKFKKNHWCNEISGTWWIGLHTKKTNCSPACVINIVDKSADVNYMCMGLLPPQKTSSKNK